MRTAPFDAPPAPSANTPDVSLITLTQTIKVITPLFGGGPVPRLPDPVTPVRVPSIRGHLRQWWRATAPSASLLTDDVLRTRESAIFGDTARPGRLRVSVSLTRPGVPLLPNDLSLRDKDRLFPVFPIDINNVRKDIEFQLTLRYPPEHAVDIEAALWAWVNFGGIGAKTRRGCGALFCEALAPKFDNGILRFPQWKQFTAAVPQFLPWPRLAVVPFAKLTTPTKPFIAWREGIEIYRTFRQRGPETLSLTNFDGLGFAGAGRRMATPMILRPVAWGNGSLAAPMVLMLRVASGMRETGLAQQGVVNFIKAQGFKLVGGFLKMAGYLLVITVGPVQEFIAAARRTRDLWAGSALLSRLSQTAALSVLNDGGKLIFPVEQDVRSDRAAIANVTLAELPDASSESAARAVADRAEAQTRDKWARVAGEALAEWASWVDAPRFNSQIGTVLEINSAWVPAVEGNFIADRRNLMRLLGGRKACRNFNQFPGHFNIKKSSLDGARESVWNGVPIPPGRATQLRLSGNEQLDAVALIKRTGAGLERKPRQFPSVPRLAADPWLRGLPSTDPAKLATITRQCETLVQQQTIVKLPPHTFPQFEAFPFEGTVAFHTRLHELGDKASLPPEARQAVSRLREELPGQPQSYMAVLQADGDRMGATISTMPTAQANRDFSLALSGFATAADQIVRSHNGCLVYAGGDDVLALLPADTAIECAAALRCAFSKAMKPWPGPTLSVGLAFGHAMEDLEDLLNYARDAEKHAKSSAKNALAVHFHPRGGRPVTVRRQWDDAADTHLLQLISIYLDDRFPDGAAYQLREMALHYKGWTDLKILSAAMSADAIRLLARKTSKRDTAALAAIRQLVTVATSGSADGLESLASELVIARRLASIYRKSGRRPGNPPPFHTQPNPARGSL